MNLSTKYLGLNLEHPLVASASPLTKSYDGIMNLVQAEPSAIVMHSLFEEQLNETSNELDHYMSYGTESFGEALTYFPEIDSFDVGPELYLEHISKAKRNTEIPIIGSLNGSSQGGWINFAKMIEEAGADALELNIYHIPTDPFMDSADVEAMYLETVRDVVDSITIPVSVKLGPFFSSIPNICHKMSRLGVKGFVLFNRFYQPDIDIEHLEVAPNLVLSNSNDMRLPLRWVAILFGKIDADFAISSGVHNATDVLKGMMAGANITMMAAELLKYGTGRINDIKREIIIWMEEHEYTSIQQMIGSMSQRRVSDPASFERSNYMKILNSYKQDPTGKLLW
jgi:dihydroorotate dehydrogenase (fumarate)